MRVKQNPFSARKLMLSSAGALFLVPGAFGLTAAHAQSPAAPRTLNVNTQMARPLTSQESQLKLTAGQQYRQQRPQRKSQVMQQLETLYQQNGMQLPEMVDPQISNQTTTQTMMQGTPSPTPNTGSSTATAQAMPRRQMSSSPSHKPSLMDRLFGGFRKSKGPSTPPPDPGMDYVTASEAKKLPGYETRDAYSNSQDSFLPPPILPGESATGHPLPPPAPGVSKEPQFVPAPAVVTSIQEKTAPQPLDSFIPPAPGEEFSPPVPTSSLPKLAESPKTVPGLKELLGQSQQPKPLPPLEKPVAETSLPKLDLNASQEELVTAAPEPLKTAELAPQESMATAPSAAADPFDNLFPEDRQATATQTTTSSNTDSAITETPPAVESSVVQQEPSTPYTGLELEEDLFNDMATPTPGHAETSVVQKESAVKTVEVPSLELPELPPLPNEQHPLTSSDQNALAKADKPKLLKPADELSLPQVELKPSPKPSQNEHQSKIELIAARDGEGLKGFCPVMLRDHRELIDADNEYAASFNGKEYYFSSEDALDAFLGDPLKYAPALRGNDVIHSALTGEESAGKLDYAVWYKGRLYLFNSIETMETFVAAPSTHATDE